MRAESARQAAPAAPLKEQIAAFQRRIDRLFACLLVLQCAACGYAAYNPLARTLPGLAGPLQAPAWAILLSCTTVTFGTIAIVLLRSGTLLSRRLIAFAQMLVSVLFTHVAEGRVGTHLPVYVSLALLAFYWDVSVIVLALSVLGADLVLSCVFAPRFVFAEASAVWLTAWRVVWIPTMAAFLLYAIRYVRTIVDLASLREAEHRQQSEANRAEIAARTSELKASLERLQAGEEAMRLIVENAPEAIITHNSGDVIVDWNPRAEQMYGWTRDEIIGRKLTDTIIPPGRRDQFRAGLEQYVATGEWDRLNRTVELTGLRKSGSEFPVEVTLVAVERSGQRILHGFVRDITEQKRAREELALRARLVRMRAETAAAMTEVSHLQDAESACCASIATLLNASIVRLWVVDDENEHILPAASAGNRAALCAEPGPIPLARLNLSSRPPDRLMAHSCPLRCSSQCDSTICGMSGEPGSHTGQLLMVDDRIVGALTVLTPEPLPEPARAALASVANTMALAIGCKSGEIARNESEQRLRLALKAGHMALWHVDYNIDRADCTDGHDLLFGFSPGEMRQNREGWLGAIHPEDREAVEHAWRATAERAVPFAIEYRIVWPDGSVHWLSSTGATVGCGTEPPRLAGVHIDITDRKMAEIRVAEAHAEAVKARTELEAANGQLEALLENARFLVEAVARENQAREVLIRAIPSILIGLDENDAVIHWNGPAETAFGIRSGDAVCASFWECGIDWDWDAIQGAVAECRERSAPVAMDDFRFSGKSRTDGLLGLTLTPVRGDDGAPMGVLIVGKDVTERRMLERQLAQAHRLEGIGQLAAGVAHEINTPTQFIGDNVRFVAGAFQEMEQVLGRFNELLEACRSNSVTQELVFSVSEDCAPDKLEFLLTEVPGAIEHSLDGVRRVTEIVQGMRQLSHPGTEGMSPTDINRAVESTTTVARNEYKYVARLDLDLDPWIPQVQCNPGEINQVILNILINASHAVADAVQQRGDGSTGLITVQTRPDGEFVEIRISDTGTGIPLSVQGRIFDPFFTTKEVGKGTGQGLAIAHTIIERHRGSIRFQTEEGVGTTFIIRLPIGASEEREIAA
jgi:PAS domain S-box-containing protein